MKIFISYKFRGTNKKDLKKKLERVISVLEKNNHQVFVYFRNKTNWKVKSCSPGRVIREAFKEIRNCDAVVGFIDEAELSEGMLLEIGFAKALNKKTVLLINKKYSRPTLQAIFDKVIRFERLQDIEKDIGKHFKKTYA